MISKNSDLQIKRDDFLTKIREQFKKQKIHMMRINLIHSISNNQDIESLLLSIYLEVSDQLFLKKLHTFIKQNVIEQIMHKKILEQIFEKLAFIFMSREDHRHQVLQIIIHVSQFEQQTFSLKFIQDTSTNQILFQKSFKTSLLYDFLGIIQNNLIYQKIMKNLQDFIVKLFKFITNIYKNCLNQSHQSIYFQSYYNLLDSKVLKFIYILFCTIKSDTRILLQTYYLMQIYKLIRKYIQNNENDSDIVMIFTILEFLIKKHDYIQKMSLQYFCFKLQLKLKSESQMNIQRFLKQEEWLTVHRLYETLNQRVESTLMFNFVHLNRFILIPLFFPDKTLLNFQEYIIEAFLKKIIFQFELGQLNKLIDLNVLIDGLCIFIQKLEGYPLLLIINICQIYLDSEIQFNFAIILKIRSILYYISETKHSVQLSEICWNLIDYIEQNFQIEQNDDYQ